MSGVVSDADRTALVTGSAKRLGAHLSRRLAAAGWRVLIHYRSSGTHAREVVSQITAAGGRARLIHGDVGRREDVRQMFDDIQRHEGRLDLLINNVGIYMPKPLPEVTVEEWESQIQVNLNGAFYCCHDALPMLIAHNGLIINIGYAGVDRMTTAPEATPYEISKVGLLILTRSIASSYGSQGVRANMISPGQLANSIDLPEDLVSAVPLGRAGTLDDIAEAMEYLLRSTYVTGVNINVAGGYRL